MSQWQSPRDRSRELSVWKYQQRNKYITDLAKQEDKSLAALRAKNKRLQQQVRQLELLIQQLQPPLPSKEAIPEVFELELMRGHKLARPFRDNDAVRFMGIGMNGIYDVEGYAECLMRNNHEVPHPDCSCGFYIPAKLGDHYGDPRQHWVLDVEFGGKVLDCGMGALPVPARGYKASWQRVLSVTAPTLCRQCGANAEHVCVQFSNNIEVLCPKHAYSAPSTEKKPLTWVREHLATELIAPNLSDAPPPEPSEPLLADWELLEQQSTSVQTWPGTILSTYYPLTTTGSSTSFPSSIWVQNNPPVWVQNGSITWTQNT